VSAVPRNLVAPGLSSRAAGVHARVIIPAPKEERPAGDFYRTPPEGVTRLLAREHFQKKWIAWEPACGDGRISKTLIKEGYGVVSSDLYRRGYGKTGLNFLTCAPPDKFDFIITNPPFSQMQKFIERALYYDTCKVAMLGRLLFLEGGVRRKTLWDVSPPARVWVFAGRINVTRAGYLTKKNRDKKGGARVAEGKGGMVAFAWYVWERGHRGPPVLGWI
jgi:hypothetical protein